MAAWVKAFIVKPGRLNLIPGSHRNGEGREPTPHKSFSDLHLARTRPPTHLILPPTHNNNKYFLKLTNKSKANMKDMTVSKNSSNCHVCGQASKITA